MTEGPPRGTILLLGGIPGVGKATVGRAYAALTGATLIENHATTEILFRAARVAPGGKVPMKVFDHTAKLYAALNDAIEAVAPPGADFVFTHTTYEMVGSRILVREFEEMAERMGADFVGVTLHCSPSEHARRVSTGERRERLKLVDRDTAWPTGRWVPFLGMGEPLMTDGMSPLETAEVLAEIVAKARATPRGEAPAPSGRGA